MLALLAAAVVTGPPVYGHDYYVSRDSGWCWFADPRAIVVGKWIVAGGVSSQGDIVANLLDWRTNTERKVVLAPRFEKDDHAAPSFLVLKDGRIAAFYSQHSGHRFYIARTVSPGDPTSWQPAQQIECNDPDFKGPAGSKDWYTYANPQRLSAEGGRIFLFYRGMNWKPTLSISNDDGKDWSTARIVVAGDSADNGNRPYVKIAGDGKKRIDMAFTDGHPRNEPTNSIYYARYENGAFRRADGSKICSLGGIPFQTSQADVVYDGKAEGVRAWIWDVAEDKQGHPVITYVRLPKETEHDYRYAWWDGRRWIDRPIVFGGKWFPQTPAGKTEPEPHYSGGVVLDHNDTRVCYVSRPIDGRFEIERWFTPDGGDHWTHVAITGNSKHDSVRPFVLRQALGNGAPAAIWVNAQRYVHYTDYDSTLQAAREDRGPWPQSNTRHEVLRTLGAVWRWARSNPYQRRTTDWTMTPLQIGLLDYAAAAADPEPADLARALSEGSKWKLGPRPFMADDNSVGQVYLQLYALDHKPEELASTKAWGDAMLGRTFDETLDFEKTSVDREWTWCDALFMAPPALAMLSRETGDLRYLDLMDRLWWKTADYLYDKKEHLFYRDSRYFNAREANGQPVFWSRGNGWVIAGLARILSAMPADYRDRGKYVELFRELAGRLASIQGKDGAWRSSLLDPESYPAPETSGTGFICYAMAWGIRNGILDADRFRPVVDRAWSALVRSVDMNGCLGWVQPVGQDPKRIRATDNDSYGVGAFLMAGSEIARR